MNLVDMRTSPPRHLWKTWQPRTQPITAVTIHHSATPPTQSIYSMAWYHVNTKDMPSIQYHYVVTCDGQACWMVDDELLVWHGNGSNDYAIGVCLVGDFTHEHPPEAQLQAARELIAHLSAKHGRDLDVIGHKEAPRAATACPGDTWDEWKGELRMTETGLPATWAQCQGQGYDDWVVDHSAQLGGCLLINPWYGDYRKFTSRGMPVAGRVVHDGDPDTGCVYRGAAGADEWFDVWFWPSASRCPEIRIWRGPNEPAIWSIEDAQALNAFYVRLQYRFRERGLTLIGINFSTGHPALVYWHFLGEALEVLDYLGRHSYSCGPPWFSPEDQHHAFRLERDVAEIQAMGFRVPPIILGETGIDRAGDKDKDGWRARGVSREEYVGYIWPFVRELKRRVPQLQVVSWFVWLSTGWPSFDIDQATSQLLVDTMPASVWLPPATAEPPIAAIVASAQAHIIPRTPGWALYEAGKARGYYEASGEFDVDDWRCQAFRDPSDARLQHIAYCLVGDWGNVRWVTVDNETHEIVA